LLRRAVMWLTQLGGVRACLAVHVAVPSLRLSRLSTSPLCSLLVISGSQRAMAAASAAVLDGFPLRSEAKLVRHPDRYQDERVQRMWTTVGEVLQGVMATAVFA